MAPYRETMGCREEAAVRVTVAFIVPEHVLDEVEAALARTVVPEGELDRVGRGALILPVFSLGNVTQPGATEVAELLRSALDHDQPAPWVHLEGVWALEAEGDRTIGLPLVGEVDRVDALVRTLWELVPVRGYFVDRRTWVRRLTIGSVTPTTTLPVLERLVDDLGSFVSSPWPVTSVALVRKRFDARDPDAWEVLDEVPTSSEAG